MVGVTVVAAATVVSYLVRPGRSAIETMDT